MANDDLSATEHDLKSLEIRIDDLIQTCVNLKDQNIALLTSQDALKIERATLIEKTELAKTRVEGMINRLKSMEIHP